MRRLCLLAAAAMLLTATAVYAQQDEGTMQMPRFSVNVTEHVKPGMMEEYIEATKKWIEAIKGEKMNMMFFAFGDMASNMHYAVPFSNMAELDGKMQDWTKAANMMRGADWGAMRQKCIEWTQYTMWYWAQEFSYMPAKPELSEEEMVYFKWADIRVSHTNEAEFNKVLMQIKAVYEKHGYGRSYNVYRNIVGLQGPFYTIVWGGKDPADAYNASQAEWKMLGEDLKPLFDKAMDLSEESSVGEGWSRPDLSLMPGM